MLGFRELAANRAASTTAMLGFRALAANRAANALNPSIGTNAMLGFTMLGFTTAMMGCLVEDNYCYHVRSRAQLFGVFFCYDNANTLCVSYEPTLTTYFIVIEILA